IVFDEHEPVSNAGAYGVNDLHLVRYTFSGRAARRLLADGTSTESLLAHGEAALNRYLHVNARQRRHFVARRFPLGLCAYTPFHASFLADLAQQRRHLRGLYLTGDYIQGASIEACFRAARDCVGQATAESNGRA